MNTNELELNRHEQAQSLHQTIVTSGSLAAQNLFDMATALKKMRDGKLYKEFGYQNFEAYCEEMVGMTRRNAYRYISIAENISRENVTPVSHFGIKKLALIASLSDEEQKQVAENIDETTTYKQIREEINKLKGEKMKLENEREKLNAKLEAEAANAEEARSDLERAEKELKVAQIKSAAEMDRANRTADKLRDKEREAARLEKENRELRERPVEVAVVDNTEEYDKRLKKALSEERKKHGEETQRLRESYDRKIEKIVAKANSREDEREAEDKGKQEFKVFLVMAHDALSRLIQAAERNRSQIYVNKIRDLLAAAIERTEDIECREQ